MVDDLPFAIDQAQIRVVVAALDRPHAPLGTRNSGGPARWRSSVAANFEHDVLFQSSAPNLGLDEIVDLVAVGRLVVVAGSSLTERLGSAVTAIPVSDPPDACLLLAWSLRVPSPQLKCDHWRRGCYRRPHFTPFEGVLAVP